MSDVDVRPLDSKIGPNLKSLREYAGLTVAELAEVAGLTADEVRDAEALRSDDSPMPSAVYDMVGALQVSMMAVLESESLQGRIAKSVTAAGGSPSARTRGLLNVTCDIHGSLAEDGVGARVASLAGSAPRRGPGQGRQDHAARLAEWAVGVLGPAGARGDVAGLASAVETRLGIDVMVGSGEGDASGDDDVYASDDVGALAASVSDPEFQFVFVNADQRKQSALFALGHALGHVLNRDDGCGLLHIDQRLGGDDNSEAEKSADLFASMLLMPEPEVAATVEEHGRGAEALGAMLARFGVGYGRLLDRLSHLGVVSAHGRGLLAQAGRVGLLSELRYSDTARHLIAETGARPQCRPPGLLAERCLRVDCGLPGPLTWLLSVDEFCDVIDMCKSSWSLLLDWDNWTDGIPAGARGAVAAGEDTWSVVYEDVSAGPVLNPENSAAGGKIPVRLQSLRDARGRVYRLTVWGDPVEHPLDPRYGQHCWTIHHNTGPPTRLHPVEQVRSKVESGYPDRALLQARRAARDLAAARGCPISADGYGPVDVIARPPSPEAEPGPPGRGWD